MINYAGDSDADEVKRHVSINNIELDDSIVLPAGLSGVIEDYLDNQGAVGINGQKFISQTSFYTVQALMDGLSSSANTEEIVRKRKALESYLKDANVHLFTTKSGNAVFQPAETLKPAQASDELDIYDGFLTDLQKQFEEHCSGRLSDYGIEFIGDKAAIRNPEDFHDFVAQFAADTLWSEDENAEKVKRVLNKADRTLYNGNHPDWIMPVSAGIKEDPTSPYQAGKTQYGSPAKDDPTNPYGLTELTERVADDPTAPYGITELTERIADDPTSPEGITQIVSEKGYGLSKDEIKALEKLTAREWKPNTLVGRLKRWAKKAAPKILAVGGALSLVLGGGYALVKNSGPSTPVHLKNVPDFYHVKLDAHPGDGLEKILDVNVSADGIDHGESVTYTVEAIAGPHISETLDITKDGKLYFAPDESWGGESTLHFKVSDGTTIDSKDMRLLVSKDPQIGSVEISNDGNDNFEVVVKDVSDIDSQDYLTVEANLSGSNYTLVKFLENAWSVNLNLSAYEGGVPVPLEILVKDKNNETARSQKVVIPIDHPPELSNADISYDPASGEWNLSAVLRDNDTTAAFFTAEAEIYDNQSLVHQPWLERLITSEHTAQFQGNFSDSILPVRGKPYEVRLTGRSNALENKTIFNIVKDAGQVVDAPLSWIDLSVRYDNNTGKIVLGGNVSDADSYWTDSIEYELTDVSSGRILSGELLPKDGALDELIEEVEAEFTEQEIDLQKRYVGNVTVRNASGEIVSQLPLDFQLDKPFAKPYKIRLFNNSDPNGWISYGNEWWHWGHNITIYGNQTINDMLSDLIRLTPSLKSYYESNKQNLIVEGDPFQTAENLRNATDNYSPESVETRNLKILLEDTKESILNGSASQQNKSRWERTNFLMTMLSDDPNVYRLVVTYDQNGDGIIDKSTEAKKVIVVAGLYSYSSSEANPNDLFTEVSDILADYGASGLNNYTTNTLAYLASNGLDVNRANIGDLIEIDTYDSIDILNNIFNATRYDAYKWYGNVLVSLYDLNNSFGILQSGEKFYVSIDNSGDLNIEVR